MADIELVDVSLRDGNQCLWSATGLNTAQTLEIAPVLDRIGFRALDYTSSTHMGISVRVHRENPWELIGMTRALMPRTHLQFIGTGFRFISWEVAHPEFMQLAYDRLVERGISRFVVLDPMHDMQALLRSARMVRKSGATEVIAALTYTVSAVHDDAFYAGLATQLTGAADVDRVYIKDPAGILTLERARALIPAVLTALHGKPLEIHSHCTIGLAPLTCLAAADMGVRAVQVAIGPLSNGGSLPNAERVLANLRELGHRVDIDDRLLAAASEYFRALAEAEGLPVGTPQEFDAAFLRHQVAGGVMTTTRRHLQEIGLEDRFDAVIEESVRVRHELGQPIMVTPFPQIVCTQALFNVIGPERYGNVSDQVIRYVLGRFGRPTGPVDPDVLDRILAKPRARELANEPPPLPPSELRRRFGAAISDEELLLRAVMPASQVDAMIAAGPARRRYNPHARTLMKLLRELGNRPAAEELVLDKPGLRLTLRGRAAAVPVHG
jgi:oxaloacetate decarboxylase alpha subunit